MALVLRILFLVLVAYLLFFRKTKPRGNPRPDRLSVDPNLDPYQVLRVSPMATPEEIKKAYHGALAQYHPDKVSHLGEEIKKVAEEKTAQIISAYEQLEKKRS